MECLPQRFLMDPFEKANPNSATAPSEVEDFAPPPEETKMNASDGSTRVEGVANPSKG